MKYINKIASAFSCAAVGIMMFTSCEGGDLYNVGSPDWLQSRIDSVANAKDPDADEYSFGLTDYSSGWWTAFSKTYVIPDGAKWTAHFNLHINPDATKAYQNFALVLTSDGWSERNGTGYTEYGAIRFDTDLTQSRNSEWGTYIDRSCISSNLNITSDDDVASLQKLGGEVTLVVDRSAESGIIVTISNEQGVLKTYTQTSQLVNINTDASNSNIDAFLCPEGSYIDFESSNITQVRTPKADSQPQEITSFNNVPEKVMLGTSFEDAIKNVSANVLFADGSTRAIPYSELTILGDPDMTTPGIKTVYVACNKTYKNQASANIVTSSFSFPVIEKKYNSIGAIDNTSGFFTETSVPVRIAPHETVISTFTNYTDGAANWDNYLVVLNNAAGGEYAVVRADNFGWGTGYAACTAACTQTDWTEWLKDMNGAVVTTYVTNNGDGTADIKAVAKAKDGDEYTQTYTGINGIDANDLYYKFTMEKAHLEFDQQLGADDNSTAFWGELSPLYNVPAGQTETIQFVNYTDKAANWDNYIVALVSNDNSTEYAVVRADNFGWGTGYAACTATCSHSDWTQWLKAMDEARVNVSVTNNGDGTANIKIVSLGSDGVTYTQTYDGINSIDPASLSFKLTLEKSHQIFDIPQPLSATSAAKMSAYRFRR